MLVYLPAWGSSADQSWRGDREYGVVHWRMLLGIHIDHVTHTSEQEEGQPLTGQSGATLTSIAKGQLSHP